MIRLSDVKIADPVACPYLPGRSFVQEYFFAAALTDTEYGGLLDEGWRRFGRFFFRPACPDCRQCVPIRIDARSLTPTRSQKRVLKRGVSIQMEITRPASSDEAWRVYRSHARGQFNKTPDREDFEKTFFDPAVPSLQCEYRLEGRNELCALGFLDIGDNGLSSVYFAFDPEYAGYSLGVLSVFREAALAVDSQRRWYYLGYWVEGCTAMDYKARFSPHQGYDWESGKWNWLSHQDVLKGHVDNVQPEKPGPLPSAETAVAVHTDEDAERYQNYQHRREVEHEEGGSDGERSRQ